ncbi:LysE family transporter [Streptomyces sp. TRM 70351]|uniref:LysE/ArgO family amino acid transporter n=1 Tax=Streptomyces sp. TRM 70351 TaxID=3116552 RepID=UPI002E7B5747|nr:LysE family transporter [Streptomyces sp. TRM 70351]MEE1930180.1 LysE family transporter [Streptomyces sp. TRM 70351]
MDEGRPVTVLLEGFVLGLAYAAPIGAQNVYVIQSAAGGPLRKSLRVALVVAAMDISLALACLYGLGAVLTWLPWLRTAMLVVGAAFLLWIGIGLARRKAGADGPSEAEGGPATYAWGAVAATAFTLTWFNPQALIDGTLLLGGFRAQLADGEVPVFVAGVAAASTLWFSTLTVLVGSFRSRMGPRVMTWINRVCGVALCALGVRLAVGLF